MCVCGCGWVCACFRTVAVCMIGSGYGRMNVSTHTCTWLVGRLVDSSALVDRGRRASASIRTVPVPVLVLGLILVVVLVPVPVFVVASVLVCHIPDATVNDEGSDVTIMFFYYDLHVAALKVDCAVYSLLGNHELLNSLGNMKYVSHKGLIEFPNKTDDLRKGRIDAFSLNSKSKLFRGQSSLSKFMGCTRQTSMIIDGYIFVHAGIMERLINYTTKRKKVANRESIITINKLISKWLLNNNTDGDKVFIMKLLAGQYMSPFWPRIFGSIKTNLKMEDEKCQQYVKPVLDLLKLKGIVVGHTPQLKNNINSTCSNTVWRVDIAGSQAFDEVLFAGVKEKEAKEIKKFRKPHVLEITLGRDGKEDTFALLPKSIILQS